MRGDIPPEIEAELQRMKDASDARLAELEAEAKALMEQLPAHRMPTEAEIRAAFEACEKAVVEAKGSSIAPPKGGE